MTPPSRVRRFRRFRGDVLGAAVGLALVLPTGARALQQQDPADLAGFRIVLDGSPAPTFPETITRDDLGRATVRAIRLTEPLVLDGQLDEAVYAENLPFGGFVQASPTSGAPASERTEAWILYDDTHIYVVCRCWDAAPPERWMANEFRRDSNGLRQNDHFGVMFDTFYDRRSGFMFYANPLGARADYSVVDEGNSNTDWNPVWDVKTGRFDGGWTIEMAIPFKSIRYRSGPDQVWGLQLRRAIRHKNEWTYLNPVPAFLAGPQALNRISAAGTLVDLDLPSAGRNLEFRPYAVGGLSTDRLASPQVDNRRTGDVGIDLRYGVTANLTADVTVNTDFAQVEVDEQQVNLTRFSLFFPEKREFFLEGRGVFDFGGGGGMGPGGGGRRDAPTLFYSRRIGLEGSQVVPILTGGRVTGKVGSYGLGLMNIQTGEAESAGVGSTNFTVLRAKRDVLRRSSLGVLFTNRSLATLGSGSSQTFGVDGGFGFFTNLQLDVFYARTSTQVEAGDPESYQAQVTYQGDRYGLQFEHLKVGRDFRPDVGFARRLDFEKSAASLRFSPRPASIASVRKFTWEASLDYFEDGMGRMEERSQSGRFNVEFESSDQFTLNVSRDTERLVRAFRVGPNVFVAPGTYSYDFTRASFQFGAQRRVSGTINVQRGGYYDGTLTSLGVSGGRMVVSNQLSLEPGLTLNRIEMPAGDVRQTLFRSRADYAFTPRMFASALVQYNAQDRTVSSNLRYRWEYHPGSEFFLVWTDERDTGVGGTGLRNRAFAIKLTRLIR